MAKMHFRYGAMNSGKTTDLIQTAHNYEVDNCMDVVVVKPKIDTKGGEEIVSRLGIRRKVDILLEKGESIREILGRLTLQRNEERLMAMADPEDYLSGALGHIAVYKVRCILVDEAQFLPPEQVDELYSIAKEDDIAVMAFGLRADFQTHAFPGSARLFELTDSFEELTTVCGCGSKARHNTRKVNGKFVFEGNQVAIDGEDKVTYESLCGKCYLRQKKLAEGAIMSASRVG